MMHILRCGLLAMALFLLCGATNGSGVANDVQELMLVLRKDAPDLVNPRELRDIPQFAKIHRNPRPYVRQILEVLEKGAFSEQEQLVFVSLMHALSISEMTIFGKELLRLREAGKITTTCLNWALTPSFDMSTTVVDNYKNASVVSLFQTISQSAFVDAQYSEWIRAELLTGNAARYVEEMRGDGDLPAK